MPTANHKRANKQTKREASQREIRESHPLSCSLNGLACLGSSSHVHLSLTVKLNLLHVLASWAWLAKMWEWLK